VSKLPYGYIKIRDAEGERIEQVPREAAAVRLARELATKRNLGYKGIADELNRLGYRTKSGALFAAQSVKLILLNPAMMGQAVLTGQGKKNHHRECLPRHTRRRRMGHPTTAAHHQAGRPAPRAYRFQPLPTFGQPKMWALWRGDGRVVQGS
jgi:hypothetical protein